MPGATEPCLPPLAACSSVFNRLRSGCSAAFDSLRKARTLALLVSPSSWSWSSAVAAAARLPLRLRGFRNWAGWILAEALPALLAPLSSVLSLAAVLNVSAGAVRAKWHMRAGAGEMCGMLRSANSSPGLGRLRVRVAPMATAPQRRAAVLIDRPHQFSLRRMDHEFFRRLDLDCRCDRRVSGLRKRRFWAGFEATTLQSAPHLVTPNRLNGTMLESGVRA